MFLNGLGTQTVTLFWGATTIFSYVLKATYIYMKEYNRMSLNEKKLYPADIRQTLGTKVYLNKA